MLALDHVVRHNRVFTGDQLRGGIGKSRSLSDRNVVFNDCGLGLIAEDNQISAMRHYRGVARSRNEQQINRIGEDDTPADVNISSIFRKSCVQRRKSISLN